MLDPFKEKIQKLEAASNLRQLRQIPENCINLSSNDYLGLNSNRGLRDEFLNQCELNKIEFSAASSRLLTGNSSFYSKLEDSLASLFGREASLVFNSGYHANIGILPALASKNDIVLADKLVHASIIDGLKLCPSEIVRYRHLDYEHLETLLTKHARADRNVFIVSESIFSMDGDCADLNALVKLKKKFGALLYIDEAHAFGAYGENGLGMAEVQNCIQDIDLIVGTFGKALASVGSYLICDDIIKQYLINHSRSLIFTTALPPINLAWTEFLLKKLPQFSHERKLLQNLSLDFSNSIDSKYNSHIIPYIFGENELTVKAAKQLQKLGYYVLPIRQPTVPKGTARLRISLKSDIEFAGLTDLITYLNKHESKLDQ